MIENQEDGPIIDVLAPSSVENIEKKKDEMITLEPIFDFSSEAKNFVENIKDKVLNKSESSFEPPPIDYEKEYNILVKCKDIANQYLKQNNTDIGLNSYLKVN